MKLKTTTADREEADAFLRAQLGADADLGTPTRGMHRSLYLAGLLAERGRWVRALVYQNREGVWLFAHPQEFDTKKIEFPDRESAVKACLDWLDEAAAYS